MVESNGVGLFVISENKLDMSFPVGEFEIVGYSTPLRLDRNYYGGGIILYSRNDILCKELKLHKLPDKAEAIFAELTIHKTKWHLIGGYNPKKESIDNFLMHIGIGIDKYLSNDENILILGDFNISISDEIDENLLPGIWPQKPY